MGCDRSYQISYIISSTQMEESILKFGKETFVTYKRENINQYYEVIAKELGKGAFGVVYKGRVRGSDGPWRAIKKIQKAQIKDLSMLLNQIEISVTLDNPNVVKIYEIFQHNNCVYIVTDLCDGGELFDRLDQTGSLSESDARVLFKQMLEGVNYLHKQNIAHRDLKPENFLFLRKDSTNLKLIDFGLAIRWENSLNEELKKKGEKKLVGTSYYLAPEIMEANYDERCDIWSLGVILYILLSALPPFDGNNDRQILESVKKMKFQFCSPEFDGVSAEAKDLIKRILMPASKRITIEEIFKHPWMAKEVSSTALKVSFRKMHEYSKFSKLKKLTATYVASQMSQKDVEKLGELFRKIDSNHDGFISIDELKNALSDEGNWFQMKELKQLMDSIDVDKNGKINYTQFLASSLEKDELFKVENLTKMFKLLDKDGNGEISRDELKTLFNDNSIENINGKSLEEIFLLCDKDKNGTIDFSEFKQAILM